jgi:hypothetical protein
MHRALSLYLGLIILTLVTGCNRVSTEEVAANSPLWGGYSQGSIYELKQDVFLIKLEDETKGMRYALSPEGSFNHPDRFYTVPKSIDVFKREGGKLSESDLVTGRAYAHPTTTLAVVTAGTRIKCTSLVKFKQWTWFFGKTNWVMPYGEILDGSHTNVLVDMTDLSIRKKVKPETEEVAIYDPNLHLLKNIKP